MTTCNVRLSRNAATAKHNDVLMSGIRSSFSLCWFLSFKCVLCTEGGKLCSLGRGFMLFLKLKWWFQPASVIVCAELSSLYIIHKEFFSCAILPGTAVVFFVTGVRLCVAFKFQLRITFVFCCLTLEVGDLWQRKWFCIRWSFQNPVSM